MIGHEVNPPPARQEQSDQPFRCNHSAYETSPFSVFGEVSQDRHHCLEPVNRLFLQDGTRLAVSKNPSGVPALSARLSSRGGARNNVIRQSTALTAANIRNLTAATCHADTIGLPFTRMITIHWEAAGVPLSGLVKVTGRFIDLLSKTLRRHGTATAWLWVHENCGPKGGHCHLLVHVPAALVPVINKLQLGWLRRITGKPYRKRVIHSEPIGGRLGLEVGNPELHAANLASALGYVLKGADDECAAAFDLSRRQPGGLIIGKRCGTSQNIAATARKGGAR